MNLFHTLVFIQLSKACAELIFKRLMRSQSLELSCSLPQNPGGLTGVHLYHRVAQRQQVTLLSVSDGGEVRVSPQHSGRLQLTGGLDSPQVNVTVSPLEPSDTGLYVWELSHREEDNTDLIPSVTKVFLLVEGSGRPCLCSSNYAALLLTIFAAAGLLVLTLSCLATERCLKARCPHRSRPPVPIYEEMTRKRQQSAVIPQNNHHRAPSHQEEDNVPVYANPNILRPQDNYYACPRQLAPRSLT